MLLRCDGPKMWGALGSAMITIGRSTIPAAVYCTETATLGCSKWYLLTSGSDIEPGTSVSSARKSDH
jgi:hypothetical protein